MRTSFKFVMLAVPLAIAAFLLGRVLWPDIPGMAGPPSELSPYFVFFSGLESLAFGIGIAFLMLGWPLVRERAGGGILQFLAFVSIAWSLVSWWPHDNMHRVNAMGNFAGLLLIEVLFHLTLIVAAFIIAVFFWKQLITGTSET